MRLPCRKGRVVGELESGARTGEWCKKGRAVGKSSCGNREVVGEQENRAKMSTPLFPYQSTTTSNRSVNGRETA